MSMIKKKLKNIVSISKGKKMQKIERSNLRYIQIEDLRGDENLKYCEVKPPIVKCNKSDILIAWDGANAGTIGFGIEGAIGSTIAKLVIKDKKVNPPYLGKFLQSKFKYLRENCTGATIPHISKYVLTELEIPLPPLEAQKRIAEILDNAAALRDKTKQLLKEYDQLAQSIFLEMFGDPVSNYKAFKRVTLNSIVNISSGSTPSRKIESYWNGDIPWVKTGEVNSKIILDTQEKITEKGLKNSSCKLYEKGSIIIAMYGQGKTRGQVGWLGIDATTNQACAVLQPSDKINFSYLYEYLKLSYDDLRSLGRGGNQPNLNAGLIKNYSVLMPPIELQNQFSEKIALIEQQKELVKQELKESEDLFQALLQKAFLPAGRQGKGELVREENFETV